jgi:protein involved in polysaccharide export with SLBB domain
MPSATPDRAPGRAARVVRPVRLTRAGAAAVALLAVAVRPAGGQQPGSGSAAVPAPRDSVVRSVGTLRPGDVLDVVVYREKELSARYLIDSRGFVQIPGLGVVQAAGLDPSQVKERLIDSLRARGFERPEISVQPLIRVSVLGQVRTPGLYPVDPGTSLIQLLTIAGGPADNADLRKTRVVRDGRAYAVDLQSALGGSSAGRVVLYSNDYVVVPKRSGWTRENVMFTLGILSAAATFLNLYVTLRR